jgi:hypothetical protein
MICICKNCNKEFESLVEKKCCSKSCVSKLPWKDPEYKKKMSEKRKEYMNRPDIKQKNSETQKRVQGTAEAKKRNSEAQKIAQNRVDVKEKFQHQMKEYWSNKENRNLQSERQREYTNRPEVKEKISVTSKEVNARPGVKECQSKATFKQWEDPIFKDNMLIKRKEYMNRPDVKERYAEQMSIRAKKMWGNPDFADNFFKNSFKYKEYLMPSGKVVKIQGYEPQVLTELLKTYSEDDIVIGVKEMNKEIGKIEYEYEGSKHTYYPDFYIKSENKIIEVKSHWTYLFHKNKNLAKEQACLKQGFNFEFKILGKNAN